MWITFAADACHVSSDALYAPTDATNRFFGCDDSVGGSDERPAGRPRRRCRIRRTFVRMQKRNTRRRQPPEQARFTPGRRRKPAHRHRSTVSRFRRRAARQRSSGCRHHFSSVRRRRRGCRARFASFCRELRPFFRHLAPVFRQIDRCRTRSQGFRTRVFHMRGVRHAYGDAVCVAGRGVCIVGAPRTGCRMPSMACRIRTQLVRRQTQRYRGHAQRCWRLVERS